MHRRDGRDVMNNIDSSQRTAAKVAGVTGLLTFAVVVVGNYVLLNPLVVPRDAVAGRSFLQRW